MASSLAILAQLKTFKITNSTIPFSKQKKLCSQFNTKKSDEAMYIPSSTIKNCFLIYKCTTLIKQ